MNGGVESARLAAVLPVVRGVVPPTMDLKRLTITTVRIRTRPQRLLRHFVQVPNAQ